MLVKLVCKKLERKQLNALPYVEAAYCFIQLLQNFWCFRTHGWWVSALGSIWLGWVWRFVLFWVIFKLFSLVLICLGKLFKSAVVTNNQAKDSCGSLILVPVLVRMEISALITSILEKRVQQGAKIVLKYLLCLSHWNCNYQDVNEAVSAWGRGQGNINKAIIFGFEADASCDEVEARAEAKPKI